jgi:hypothetical protein
MLYTYFCSVEGSAEQNEMELQHPLSTRVKLVFQGIYHFAFGWQFK